MEAYKKTTALQLTLLIIVLTISLFSLSFTLFKNSELSVISKFAPNFLREDKIYFAIDGPFPNINQGEDLVFFYKVRNQGRGYIRLIEVNYVLVGTEILGEKKHDKLLGYKDTLLESRTISTKNIMKGNYTLKVNFVLETLNINKTWIKDVKDLSYTLEIL